MISPYTINKIYNLDYSIKRGISMQVHISDIHFGRIDPKVQYNILKEQFINVIDPLRLDCISIDGDLFDRLTMSNSDATLYANLFVSDLIAKCRRDRTTLVLLQGTKQHDSDQLKIFYPYLNDATIDIRIVEKIQFEIINGCKVLCIPELYKVPESEYNKYLHESGLYDMVFMHGTIEGAVYGNNSGESKCFKISDFDNCMGLVIAGHVHTGGCFEKYMYYNGSPIRWQFGEEEEKGFQIVLYDMDSRYHYVYKQPIQSFRYDTINIDDILMNDPKDVIVYINSLKESQNIDYLRIKMTSVMGTKDNIRILEEYYRTRKDIKLKIEEMKSIEKQKLTKETEELYDKFSYIFNKSMSEYDILAKFICDNEDGFFISGEEIKRLVSEL